MAARSPAAPPPSGLPGAKACRRTFLRQFPGGFRDPTYLGWERDYKVETHRRWQEVYWQHRARCSAVGKSPHEPR